uniref:Uncharacterized protein n=1 Tax=Oryza sativa subsp. japonica TaxID=39947 RepID=Q6Z735_ORYSJ|nr:hypothetical protein [Oryza sativa Japonica Group]
MVEDAVTGDEFPAWHGYGRRRMQPPGQAPAWCRAWIAKDVVWGVAAEAATASNKSSNAAAGDDLRREAWTTENMATGDDLRHGV